MDALLVMGAEVLAVLRSLDQKLGESPIQPAAGSVMPEIMTREEVADYLRVSLRFVDELLALGELVPMRMGRSVRLDRETVRAYARQTSVRGRSKGASKKARGVAK